MYRPMPRSLIMRSNVPAVSSTALLVTSITGQLRCFLNSCSEYSRSREDIVDIAVVCEPWDLHVGQSLASDFHQTGWVDGQSENAALVDVKDLVGQGRSSTTGTLLTLYPLWARNTDEEVWTFD